MMRKTTIAFCIFGITLCYIISPWFFEKRLLFNELLSLCGFLLLIYKRFKVGADTISLCILSLLAWCGVHLVTSVFRADTAYYYLRNSVIVYSIFTYFIGFYCYKYLARFLAWIRKPLKAYIAVFLFFPVSHFLFERFGMATLFPALYRKAPNWLILPVLIGMNFIYAFTYDSATAIIITAFYILLWISPGYRFFKQVVLIGLLLFTAFFIYMQPNLGLIANRFTPFNDNGIMDVRNSSHILAIDPNSTWRLVLWKEVIFDHFPGNLFGLGFGTPVMKYFPVEDYSKLATLPYVLGAHNSYVYLFGRLGIVYVLITLVMYREIFREYFYENPFYYSRKTILFFWSFFAVSVIAVFNPTLESPIYSGLYWLLLGFLAKAIRDRKLNSKIKGLLQQ